MAERRMLSRKVVETDQFLELPFSCQALYLHMTMAADDDGFLDNVKSIMAISSTKPSDLSRLIKEGYILQVSERVYVIRHWKMNNWIQSDRYKETIHKVEKGSLCNVNSVWEYREGDVLFPMDTQDSEGKDSEDKGNKGKKKKEEVKHKHGVYGHVLLSDRDFETLVDQFPFDYQGRINTLDEYLENHKGKSYSNHLLTIQTWARKDKQKQQQTFAEIMDTAETVQQKWDIEL